MEKLKLKTPGLDTSAALASVIVAALGAAGLMTRWNLTADQVAFALGVLMVVAAVGRLLYEKWRDDHHLSVAEVLEVVAQLRVEVEALVSSKEPTHQLGDPDAETPRLEHEEILR